MNRGIELPCFVECFIKEWMLWDGCFVCINSSLFIYLLIYFYFVIINLQLHEEHYVY